MSKLRSVLYVTAFLCGADAKSKLYRRSIARYLVASQVLVLRTISMQIKKQFPTIEHIVNSQLLTASEVKELDEIEANPGDSKYWVPILWAINILHQARRENRIPSDILLRDCVAKVNECRGSLGALLLYDWVNVPLVYTQLVSLAVWAHFAAALVAEQWLDYTKDTVQEPPIDLYIPLFTILRFVCLVGWLRVAQEMLNPLGEGDDDAELNWLMERNLQTGLLAMDELHGTFPELKVDGFTEEDVPGLPHTEASFALQGSGMMSSCAAVEIPSTSSAVASRRMSHNSSPASTRSLHSIRSRLASIGERFRRSGSSRSDPPKPGGTGRFRLDSVDRRLSRQSSTASRNSAGAKAPARREWDERHTHAPPEDRFHQLETLEEEDARKMSRLSRSEVQEVDEGAAGTSSDSSANPAI